MSGERVPSRDTTAIPSVFDGPGEVRARLRQIDWGETPLGPVESWPETLRVPVSICVNSRVSMSIWWGPELTLIYNDAYAPILGRRHPNALGRPAREVWADVWSAISPQLEAVARGESTLNERNLVPTDRNGVFENAWFTWSYTPILDVNGKFVGSFVVCTEDTQDVLRERELTETRDRLADTLSAAEIGSWSLDASTGRVRADANLARSFGISKEIAASGAPLQVFTDAIHPGDRVRTVAAINEAVANRESFDEEYRLAPQNGLVRWVIARGRVARGEAGRALNMSGVLIDITERKRSEKLIAAQNHVLQLLASETSLSRIMEEMVRHVEADSEGSIASILLVDGERRLRHGAAPSLPDDFNRAVDGIVIGANVGTCGRAAFRNEVVVTLDLATDPNWVLLRERVVALGLRAAWSMPIISTRGKILGTFGTYFRENRGPTTAEKTTVDFMSKLAALAIERAQAQEILRESEERFRMLADNIAQSAWMANGTGTVIWYNQRWLDYIGRTPEQMKDWDSSTVHHPDYIGPVRAKFAQHVKEGKVWEDTFPLRGADGKFRWFLSRAVPIRDSQDRVVRWFGTNTDVTALRETQEELRLSESRFRQIADTLPQIVWGAGTDGVLDYYNRRWFDYIGLPYSDLETARWDNYIHPEDLPATYETWMAALQSGKIYQMEFRVRDAVGVYHWFLARALPIRDADGKIVRWFGTCTDIDDRKAAHEENLRLMERERAARLASENAGRMKDDFLATLSHELRTPLNPVLLLASEAAGNLNLPPEVRADFEAIAKNVALEARLIDDLLDLTRITRGKMALTPAPADLHGVIRDALANVAPEIEEKKIKVTTSFAAVAPTVVGDVVRLQQVFWNILRNAAKFTPRGGSIAVSTQVTPDLRRVEVVISDTGMGMNQEELGRLFNAFAQGDHAGSSGSHRFGGLGLGLAISRMLVELHSGRIFGASEGPGRGSTFSVQLPLAAASPDRPALSPASPLIKPAPSQAPFPNRILLVEDHEPTRTSLKQLLLRRHYEVTEAGSVAHAIVIAATLKFDLLVTDIGLPDGDGYELMRALSASRPIRGIALTGYGMQEDIERSRVAGFADHLTKPIRVQDLDAALNSLAATPPLS